MIVTIRRATVDDLDFIVDLFAQEDIHAYLAAARAYDPDTIRDDIRRSTDQPNDFGLFVIEVDRERAGTMRFVRSNALHRIADLGGLAVHHGFRGRGVADEAARLFQRHLFENLGFHRLQLEVYGFNERAMRHAERVGYVLEGRKRRAYHRHGEWVDGVIYGLTAEDLQVSPEDR